MNTWRTAWLVLRKDLRIEWRTREIVTSAFIFALLVVVLCAFAFDLHVVPPQDIGAGILWIALCFAGVLATSRTYLRERENNAWSALVLSGAAPAGIYLGKWASLFAFLTAVAAVLVPVVQLLFHVPLLTHWETVFPLLALGLAAFCAAAALFGVMIVRTSTRDLLLGVVLFPLISPALILGAKATAQTLLERDVSGYVRLLVVLLAIFGAVGSWLYESLIED